VPLGQPGTRLRAGFVFIMVLLVIVSGRLVWLQGVQSTAYAVEASQQRTRTSTLMAPRGSITDRAGQPLAMSIDARAVYGEPRTIARAVCTRPRDGSDPRPCTPETVAAAVAPVLDLPVEEVRERLERPLRSGDTCSKETVLGCSGFVYLARGLDPDVAGEVRDLRLVGIGTMPEPRRVHPGNDLAANVVGFTDVEGKGAAGVELALEEVLSGENGTSTAQVDGSGRVIPNGSQVLKPPVPGRDVHLTIDRDLQWYTQQVLMRTVEEADAESASAVVMDVTTGEVLALASVPTFDADAPNEAPAELRGNRAVSDVFEPGSIGKVITAAAALEADVVTPDTVMTVPDRIQLSNKRFKDSHDHPPEEMTFTGVMVESSNVGTIMAAQRLGPGEEGGQKLYEMLRRFGLGERTGIGLPGESRGIVPEVKDWYGTTYGALPIGQSYSVNGLQMASVYATIANDGVKVPARIVRSSTDAEGNVVPAPAAEPVRVLSPEIAAQLRLMLEGVTNEGGTAKTAAIPGYRVAGKTGTAQRVVDGRYQGYTASFVGFAPADAPRLVMSVSVQDPKNGYYGGVIAGPAFREVMAYALRALQVPPTGAPPARLRLRADDPQ
jgi:cell division protein FtsI (penicillin-binding protein 3)